jgi:Cytosolic carboxypeptidase N-terminal domain
MQAMCSWVHQSNYANPGTYMQAVVSYDRKHWARTDTEYDEKSGHLVIKHTAKYVRMHSGLEATAGNLCRAACADCR